MDSYNQFAVDLNKWVAQTQGRLQSFVQEFTQDIAEEILIKTPVDTGFARACWSACLNEDYQEYTPAPVGLRGKVPVFEDIMTVQARLVATINMAMPGDVIHLINNCRYINVLEDGYADRPARNFVKGTLADQENIAERVIARITK